MQSCVSEGSGAFSWVPRACPRNGIGAAAAAQGDRLLRPERRDTRPDIARPRRRVAGVDPALHASVRKHDRPGARAIGRLTGRGNTARQQHTKRSDAMKISARNVLKGRIVEVTKGATTAHVKIDVGGTIVTSSITNASVDDLKLVPGKDAYAVIKASDVMVGID
jgi:molybdopterin-binding protein